MAGVTIGISETHRNEAYLNAGVADDVPADATVTDYEDLSPDEQELYGRLVSTDEMIRINESVRSKRVPGIDYLRYDGEVYWIGEIQN